ncbi:hypothetical protein AMATHDRAFT_44936 [Amanita thiersii Skay4041]|uniref:Peptidase M20 dimerisation domain-containing protein n=1 Tax=Amanita thiersii Skay4041 TaxID=703135 RepID=A0A2A9P072_9AGAR|nr:hypothetical protein AMATHDRAFT_44936 [Amanita thiersii Skay4041]
MPPASLSRELQSDSSAPSLLHSLHESRGSVLSLAADDKHIFAGTQRHVILVWDKSNFTLRHTLRGHKGSVLALEYAKDKEWLFSSGGDSTVRIWSTTTFYPIYVLDPYLETDAGDLFSLSWFPSLQTVYIGCQNTSIQWFNFRVASPHLPNGGPSIDPGSPGSGSLTPSGGASTRKAHKFFDSYPQYQRRAADIHANNSLNASDRYSSDSDREFNVPAPQSFIGIPASNVIDAAHYGYIYCMTRIDSLVAQLATGSGDETVKIWNCSQEGPILVATFEFTHGAVLALASRGDTLYAGCQDGYVKVLDLETQTLVRTIIVQEVSVDILALSIVGSDLYTCSADGWIKRWSSSFDCTGSWEGHTGIALSSIIYSLSQDRVAAYRLATGGNDERVKVWGIYPSEDRTDIELLHNNALTTNMLDTMIYALSKFVTIKSVSSLSGCKEDCRQAAIWLKKCLAQLGAQASLISTGEEKNPLVLATFSGTKSGRNKPRLLFYGHYDIIAAPGAGWETDPYKLTGRNGYLYGRGVTDNKGPIMAVACAAAELLSRRALGLDLVFLIEGEEECGSVGFKEAVKKHKDLIGEIDAILVSNSTWITDGKPCITYGLRGVVHSSLEVSSGLPDLHSGVEGGAVAEPMCDMVKLLGTLIDDRSRVMVPGFYNQVRPQTEEEKELYQLLSKIAERTPESLSARWREPSMTIHKIEISGPKNATVIPGSVKAQISLRIVPDQDLDTIATSLCDYLIESFQKMSSPNNLKVKVEQSADWWLGNLDDSWFKALESSIAEEWGEIPLRIREGGSIPSVPYLEKEFGCHALHLPMGQSTDQAHLPNERISITNLQKGKAVIERFLLAMADKAPPMC